MSEGPEIDDRPWHALEAREVSSWLGVDAALGLPEREIARRRAEGGENRLSPRSRRSAWQRLFAQIHNLFIYLLLAAAAITAALGEWLDAGVITFVVAVIALIGFVQEGRAERALESVREMLAPRARVLRDGRPRAIDAAEIVRGDVVLLSAGDRVPADLRLVEAKHLSTQEAALTGESSPMEKSASPAPVDAELAERTSMVYSATLVTSGEGRGVAVAIGDASEIGRISRLLEEVEVSKTPLDTRLDALTKALSVVILALSALTFAVGSFVWSRPADEMFFAAVAIAVAAVPEGLPAVMTVTLALGVTRMARRNAIIRRLPAVETLGSVTVICSDKTGTLTKNEMTATSLRTTTIEAEVGGAGYRPEGTIQVGGGAVDPGAHPELLELVRGGLLCSDATLHHHDGEWIAEGDPTEAALVALAKKAGLDPDAERRRLARIDGIPFASEHRYMATLHRAGDECVLIVKGAPEQLLEMCVSERRGTETAPIDRAAWQARIDALAACGQRVLALGTRTLDARRDEIDPADAERELTLVGLFGLIDPPREEAIEAVRACRTAGIRVKMITGDHALTAQAVARQLHLENTEDVLGGRQLAALDAESLARAAREVDVFARTSPEEKLRLVDALEASREITAMTGDGVNDAPALKRANIGIAMGLKGTDVAREAAAMVLADDNFASIERAIEEGRTVYDNLKKAIGFILPTSAAEALIVAVAILAGAELPITPLQILWVNMVTAATLGMALAWEPAEGHVMHRTPRPPREPLLTPFMIWRIVFVGLLLLLGSGLSFLGQLAREPSDLPEARTVAVNAMVVAQMFYLLSARFDRAPALSRRGLLGNPAFWIAIASCLALQLVFTHVPLMNRLFRTTPLDLSTWGRCVAVGGAIFVAVELEKAVRRARARRRA